MSTTKLWGYLARYENPAELYHACEKVRDEGYQRWDACTPFPVHGLERAMGMKPTILPWIVLVCGVTGSVGMLGFLIYAMNELSPYIVGGKPIFSLPAYVPIWYEMTVLSSCLAAFLGNWILNGLPRPHHPAFASKAFERVTDDKFFIMIEAKDKNFDTKYTRLLLESTGASLIEELED
jgi:hypothetical protein